MTTMRKHLLGVAAAALLATPAFAQDTANQTINLNGTQANSCTLVQLGAAVPTGSISGTVLTGTVAFNSATAVLPAGTFAATFTGMCNYVHNVSVRSTNGGMVNASAGANAPVAGTFATKLGYQLNLAWAGQTLTNTTVTFANSTAATPPVPGTDGSRTLTNAINGAASGSLVVTIGLTGSAGNPVVAGAYSDAVAVRLGAVL